MLYYRTFESNCNLALLLAYAEEVNLPDLHQLAGFIVPPRPVLAGYMVNHNTVLNSRRPALHATHLLAAVKVLQLLPGFGVA